MQKEQIQIIETVQQKSALNIDLNSHQDIKTFIINYKRQKIVKGIKVPVSQTNHYHKQVKKTHTLLDIQNLEKIIPAQGSTVHKIILVQKAFSFDNIELAKNQQGQSQNKCQLVQCNVTLDYHHFSTQQIFSLFTPSFVPFPNSFQTIGHLAHYNLTSQQAQYHNVIGEITLLKCPNITCVVQKTQKLHNVYRTPTLLMIGGVQQYTVKLKEVGTMFQFDFQKVYWCSRLQQERDRLLAKMIKGQALADIFCGAGPLAVRAAKKGLYVIANDLNPHGYQYLVHNSKLNKVQKKMICWNMCAREAMRKIYKEKQEFPAEFRTLNHIYMNLPVDAIQFLDVLNNYGTNMKTQLMPLVHVNCFVVADTDQKSKTLLAQRIGKVLPGFSQNQIIEMGHIKNVTIIMRMYCVTFRLRQHYTAQIGENQQQKINGQKKIKLNQNI